MHKFRLLSVLAVIIMAILLGACAEKRQTLQMCEEKADQVYDAIAKKQFGAAALMYSPRFYERISKTEWIRLLSAVQEKLGPYKSRKLVNKNVQTGFADISSITAVLVYRVQYEKESAIEKLTFVRKTPDSNNVELVGHSIDFKVVPKTN